MSDLLHSALNRAAFQAVSPTVPERGRFSALSLEDDSDLIPVETPINSPPASVASSRNSSRSSSPTRRSRSGAGKPRRDKTAEKAKEQANRESRDPLVRLENVVSERIFRELGVDDLLACGAVCKRWRGSHTINYTWYQLLQSLTFTEKPAAPVTKLDAQLLWTRRDSKIDWRARFASIYATPVIEEGADEVNEEGLSMKEEREEKWREENEELELQGTDKAAMRGYYKNLGNSKVKGKTGKGSAPTWVGDYVD